MTKKAKYSEKSYSDILKSSSFLGGAQGIILLIGMVQTKFVAIFLGPYGVGLSGTYSIVITLASRISGLGLGASGVKAIAEAKGRGDESGVFRVSLALRRICFLTGLIGVLVLILMARSISEITFGNSDHLWAFSAISIVILLTSMKSANLAYLQGMRQIKSLALIRICGAVVGALLSIPLYIIYGLGGIIPAIILVALVNYAVSKWFLNKQTQPTFLFSWRQSMHDAKGLLQLGVALWWVGLLVTMVSYLTRVIIISKFDLFAVGLFQSSFRLSGLFVGFILAAMGTDFFPRLSQVANDKKEVCRMVNEQTEIALLLSAPGILILLSGSPLIINLFYSSEFIRSIELLNWFVLGCLVKIISWPLGFILLATSRSKLFAVIETAIAATHLGLIFLGVQYYGLIGVAVAYLTMYVIYLGIIYYYANVIVGFHWSGGVKRILIVVLPSTIGVFSAVSYMDGMSPHVLGALVAAVVGFYCLRRLIILLGSEHRLARLCSKFPFF